MMAMVIQVVESVMISVVTMMPVVVYKQPIKCKIQAHATTTYLSRGHGGRGDGIRGGGRHGVPIRRGARGGRGHGRGGGRPIRGATVSRPTIRGDRRRNRQLSGQKWFRRLLDEQSVHKERQTTFPNQKHITHWRLTKGTRGPQGSEGRGPEQTP